MHKRRALVDRLACMDPAQPGSDKPTIERAITLHLAALELAERPCVWAEDALAASRGEGRQDAALDGKMRVKMAADTAASQTPAWGVGIYAQAATTDVERHWARFAAEEAVTYIAQVSGFDMDAYRGRITREQGCSVQWQFRYAARWGVPANNPIDKG